MISKIVEVTNDNQNWGKFMVMRYGLDERERRVKITGEDPNVLPLLRACGRDPRELWVLDLQTGEGLAVSPHGLAAADLDRHRVWVCPMFEPFLTWLYAHEEYHEDIASLPDTLDLPDAAFALHGYRRRGKK